MRRKIYGSTLTKELLMKEGITDITADGRVFKGDIELCLRPRKDGYVTFGIYQRDEFGNPIKMYYRNRPKSQFTYKMYTIGVHRAMWAWFYGSVPEGMVIDHINNNKSDNRIDNLQLFTPQQNILKEKYQQSERLIKCRLDKPLSFYEEKLTEFETLYTQAKIDHDAKACHALRGRIAEYRAKIRYYKINKENTNE